MKREDDHSTFDAEQEILSILSQVHIKKPQEEAELSPTEEESAVQTNIPAAPDGSGTSVEGAPLILSPDVDEQPTALKLSHKRKAAAPAPVVQTEPLVTDTTNETPVEESPFAKIGRGICGLFPKKGDAVSECVRKCVFLFSLVVFLVSLGFLTYYMVIEPNEVNKENDSYASLFNDTDGNNKAETNSETQSIQSSFRQLHKINKDIAGWLAYNSTDSDKFMRINLPVVWSGDNDTYLHRGFDGKYSRSGTLFFEQSNIIKEGVSNKVTIIYGHNMASGTMFAPLNKVIGNVYRARSAATFNLDTLYDSGQYKVFAVVISDEGADAAHRFGYLRTAFADDDDFMSYVDELRARSLFDYPVDVQPNDELVILSTCTNKSQVKVADGRCAIIARRVRDGENTTTDTAKIVKNDDVIMPYAWYTAQDLTPHAFYTQDDFVVPETDNSTTTATTGDTGTTDTDTTTTQTTTANTTENGTTDSATTTTQTTVGTTTETVATTQTTADVTENTTTSTETNTTS